jgi:hypothetical protein
VPGIDVVAEALQLPLDVEIDFLVPDVKGSRSDDELGRESRAFDAYPLELGLDAVEGGEERELKDLFPGKAPQGLVIAVQHRAPQVLADAELDGYVQAAAERISVSGREKQDTQKPDHGKILRFLI